MRSLFTLCLLMTGMLSIAQQKTFMVQDSETKALLPYAMVNLLNGFGVYANDGGVVVLTDGAIKTIELSLTGYETRIIEVSAIEEVVFLNPKPIELDEVVVEARKVKKGEEVIKVKGHQDEMQMYVSGIGWQYAFLVTSKEKNAYLNKIVLPLMKKDFVVPSHEGKYSPFKKSGYSTLIKVEVLENDKGWPGENLNDFEQVVLVDSRADKSFEIKLDNEIPLPLEGCFVKLTIIGSADDNGRLISEVPYNFSIAKDGTRMPVKKQIQPNFPVLEKPKGPETFVRSSFIDTPWMQIDRPLVFNPDKKYKGFNIGFGYALQIYE